MLFVDTMMKVQFRDWNLYKAEATTAQGRPRGMWLDDIKHRTKLGRHCEAFERYCTIKDACSAHLLTRMQGNSLSFL